MAAKLHALMRPRLQTTIATGPGRLFASRVADVLVLLPVPVRDLPVPLDPRTARPLRGTPARVGSPPSTISPTAATGSRSRASRRAVAIDPHAGVPQRSRCRRAVPRSRSSATRSDPRPRPSASFTYTQHDAERAVPVSPGPARDGGPLGTVRPVRGYVHRPRRRQLPFRGPCARPATDEVSDPAAGWFFRVDTTGPTMAFSTAPLPNTRSDARPSGSNRRRLIAGSIEVHGRREGGRLLERPRSRCRTSRTATHTLIVKATDVAGEQSGPPTYGWTVDRLRPNVVHPGLRRGSCRRTHISAFNLWSSEGPGFFGCSLDGGVAMPCFGAPNFYGLREGRHS